MNKLKIKINKIYYYYYICKKDYISIVSDVIKYYNKFSLIWLKLICLVNLNKTFLLATIPGSTKDIAKNSQVVIYPVPAQNQLYIKPLENSAIQSIAIRTFDGRLVKNASNINTTDVAQVNISDLTSGQYIVEVKTSKGIQNQIISKN